MSHITPSLPLAAGVLAVLWSLALWATMERGCRGKRAFFLACAGLMAFINPAMLLVATLVGGALLWGLYHADDFAP